MLLHGNARLTPFQRSLLCVRVRDEGWTVAEAAEAAGCAERTAYRWLARHDAGEAMTDRSSAPKTCPTRTPVRVEAQIERSAAVALDQHADRGDARDGGLDGVRSAEAARVEPALETRAARTTEPVLPSSCRRARARRREETRPVPSARQTGPRRGAGPAFSPSGMGSRARLHRRRHPPRLRRGPPRRTRHHHRRVLRTSRRLVRPARRAGPPGHLRQRRALQVTPLGGLVHARIASSISAPGPTGLAPTAKPNGSSKPCCANGPTPLPIAPQRIAPVHSPPGSTTTTTNDHTAPSATRHPPAGFTPTDQRQWELHLEVNSDPCRTAGLRRRRGLRCHGRRCCGRCRVERWISFQRRACRRRLGTSPSRQARR